MCERLILNGSAYICGDCWDELLKFRLGWPDVITAREVEEAIKAFMDTRVGSHRVLDREGIDDEFKRLTGA
jgi:hypothetical protein